MAAIRVDRPVPVPQPDVTITLKLTREEAQLIRDLVGATPGSFGPSFEIFDALRAVPELRTIKTAFRVVEIGAA
jgi:hypothetical protein